MISRPSHLLLSVIDGEAREKSLGLEWGQHRRPFSVGAEGEWAVRAPGVADVHLYLAFRGSRLCVAPASAETRVRAGGVRLPETWSELPLPAELRFGQARLRARAALSSKDTLATTHEVDPKKLAPLLDASRPRGARSRAALLETVLQKAPPAPRSPLLETMCDGGALLREAERVAAETRAQSVAQPAAPAGPPLHAPDPSAFAAEERAEGVPDRAALVQQLAKGVRSLQHMAARGRSRASRRLSSLRRPLPAAGTASTRLRRGASAALAVLLLAVLALRLLAPVSSSAPLSEDTAASADEGAAPAHEENERAGLGTASPDAEASLRAELAPAPAEAPSPVALEAPSPQLQREAFRAAVSGDSAAAAALYQQLSTGPDARLYQLAARYAAQGRVRKP